MTEIGETVTLHLPFADCEIVGDQVLYALPVDRWREWMPALQAALDGMPPVDELDVRGQG
jgi:hypothetical protein